MVEVTPEHLFERFRRKSNPDDLAQVFDRLSPRVHRLAVRLTDDPTAADDLLQSTFVTAIERSGEWDAARPLLPWLMGILTNHAHRLRRSRATTADPTRAERAVQTPIELAEAAEAAKSTRLALRTLPRPYRSVLTLRYIHGLGAGEIGEILDLSPGAVRVRLHRGLEMLRRALPVGVGALAALGLACRGTAGVRSAVLEYAASTRHVTTVFGLIAMKQKWIMIAAAAALFLAPIGWSIVSNRGPEEESPAAPLAIELTASPEPSSPANDEPEQTRTSIARTAVRDPADSIDRPSVGALRILTRWDDDGSPAAGIGVYVILRAGGSQALDTFDALVGDRGEVVVDSLPPGPVDVRTDRGTADRAIVVAGEETQLRFDIPRGRTIRGRVVDAAGQPVFDAGIWLSEQIGERRGQVVTRTDAAGRFELAGISNRRHVAAIASNHAPTPQVLVAPGTTELELRLGPEGGALHGRVLQPNGRPIRGAIAVLDHDWERTLDDGRVVLGFPPRRTRTDTAGRFAFEGVPAGLIPLVIRSAGFAPLSERIAVDPGRATDRDLILDRGARLTGRIAGPDDEPVAGARVWVRGLGAHEFTETRSAADGTFSLDGISAEFIEARVDADGFTPCHTTRWADPGESIEWIIRLTPRASVTGRLIDSNDKAMPEWLMMLHNDDRRFGDYEYVKTDARGRFEVDLESGVRYRVHLRHPRTMHWAAYPELIAVAPPNGKLLLRVAHAVDAASTVRGRVISADGKPVEVSAVRLEAKAAMNSSILSEQATTDTGEFESKPVPPGRYDIRLELAASGAEVSLGWHDIEARQPLNLGDVQLASLGRVRCRFVPNQGGPVGKLTIDIRGAQTFRTSTEGANHELALPAGAYEVRVLGNDFVTTRFFELTLRAGHTQDLQIPLERGVRRMLVYPYPPPDGWDSVTEFDYCITDDDGTVLMQSSSEAELGAPLHFRPALAAKGYRLDISAADGRRWSGRFQVESLRPSDAPIRISVRPVR